MTIVIIIADAHVYDAGREWKLTLIWSGLMARE